MPRRKLGAAVARAGQGIDFGKVPVGGKISLRA